MWVQWPLLFRCFITDKNRYLRLQQIQDLLQRSQPGRQAKGIPRHDRAQAGRMSMVGRRKRCRRSTILHLLTHRITQG